MDRRHAAAVTTLLVALTLAAGAARGEIAWRPLETGLDLAEIDAPVKSKIGTSKITVLRIDPRRFGLRLLSAKELKTTPMPAHDWARRFGLVAAVNAGMFRQDHRTSVGYMKNFKHLNNPRMTRDYNVVLAFNPRTGKVPAVQIIDLRCQDFAKLKDQYDTLIQSLRMVDCNGRNRWGVSARMWSTVAIADTRDGKILFVHARSPYPVRVFVDMLLKLPLNLRAMMYLEGGPEATLYLKSGKVSFEKVGSYETGFREDDTNRRAWALPNVIGVVRRAATAR